MNAAVIAGRREVRHISSGLKSQQIMPRVTARALLTFAKLQNEANVIIPWHLRSKRCFRLEEPSRPQQM